MKLSVRNVGDPNSDKHMEIEEFWASPTSWKRIVTAPDLKQIVAVDASGKHVQSTGAYFPVYLQAFITALEDPIPAVLRQNAETELPPQEQPVRPDRARCVHLSVTAKDFPSAPAGMCFASNNWLNSITYPGYQMEFNEYSPFAGKDVPHLYLSQNNGYLLVGKINLLEKLPRNADLSVPAGSAAVDPLASALINPLTFKQLAKTPLIVIWPEVPRGKTKGEILAYLSLDNAGTPREVIILKSDNLNLNKIVRQKLLDTKWRPAAAHGSPIQVTSLLSFPFETTSSSTILDTIGQTQTISSDTAKGLVIFQPRPQYPIEARMNQISGTVYLSALIDETGSIAQLGVIESPSNTLSVASLEAVAKWKYQPYLVDGTPTPVSTMITINFSFSR